jgi:hypothetical protein
MFIYNISDEKYARISVLLLHIITFCFHTEFFSKRYFVLLYKLKTKLSGANPRVKYTDQATSAC